MKDPIENRDHLVYTNVEASAHPPLPQSDFGAPTPEPVPAPGNDPTQGQLSPAPVAEKQAGAR
jgi:hypothetical protein